jgi:hypothetical protein
MLINILIWVGHARSKLVKMPDSTNVYLPRLIAGELRGRHSTRTGWHGTQTTAVAFCKGVLLNRRRLLCIPSFWPLPAQVF